METSEKKDEFAQKTAERIVKAGKVAKRITYFIVLSIIVAGYFIHSIVTGVSEGISDAKKIPPIIAAPVPQKPVPPVAPVVSSSPQKKKADSVKTSKAAVNSLGTPKTSARTASKIVKDAHKLAIYMHPSLVTVIKDAGKVTLKPLQNGWYKYGPLVINSSTEIGRKIISKIKNVRIGNPIWMVIQIMIYIGADYGIDYIIEH